MKTYVLAAAAELDVDAIWEYIAEDNIDAADRWAARLFDAFEALAAMPGMGHARPDLTSLPVLFWPVAAYLIVYRVRGEEIQIVAITQGARDVPTFLQQRSISS